MNVFGTGFQLGAIVSFSGKGIRVLNTEFKTSTTLKATVLIASIASPGFYDVVVTNPIGETTILENGFRIVR